MMQISTSQFLGFDFSVIYNSDSLLFAGFFSLSGLPAEFKNNNPSFSGPKTADLFLRAYVRNHLESLPFPLVQQGTPFQTRVLKVMTQIPTGETWTYETLAQRSGNEKAVRAAASACAKNRFSLIVPCHRVVGKNKNGGYRWGLNIKQNLIDWESEAL